MATPAHTARAAFLHAAYTLSHATVGVELQVKDIIAPLALSPELIDASIQYGVDRQWYRPHFTWGRNQGFRLSLTAAGIDAAEALEPALYTEAPRRGPDALAPAYPAELWSRTARPSSVWRVGAAWTAKGAQPGEPLGYGEVLRESPELDLPLEVLAGVGMAAGVGSRTVVIGPTGSGKTQHIIRPFLRTWMGASSVPAGLLVYDWAGELADLLTPSDRRVPQRPVRRIRPDGQTRLWPAHLTAAQAIVVRQILLEVMLTNDQHLRRQYDEASTYPFFHAALMRASDAYLSHIVIETSHASATGESSSTEELPYHIAWDRVGTSAVLDQTLAEQAAALGGELPRDTAELLRTLLQQGIFRLERLRPWGEAPSEVAVLAQGPAVGEVWVLEKDTLTAHPQLGRALVTARLRDNEWSRATRPFNDTPAPPSTPLVVLSDEAHLLGDDVALRLSREGRKNRVASLLALQSHGDPSGWENSTDPLVRSLCSNATTQMTVHGWHGPASGSLVEVRTPSYDGRENLVPRRIMTGPLIA